MSKATAIPAGLRPENQWRPAFWRALDPSTATFIIAVWALANAFSFVASASIQARPLFFYINQIGLSDITCATILSLNAITLIASLTPRATLFFKTTIAFSTFLFWGAFGVAVISGGLREGIYPINGVFNLVCCIGSFLCMLQWAFQEAGGDHSI